MQIYDIAFSFPREADAPPEESSARLWGL